MQPGQFAPRGEDWIARELKELRRMIQENAAANPFAPMGIKPVADGLNITGNLAVTGTLSLPNGIIDNAALASPLAPGSAGLTQQNFATSTAGAILAQASITVPAGYTRAMVMNGASAGAVNSTAAADFIQVQADINGTSGGGQLSPAQASGGYGSASSFAIRTLTGLSGGTITVGCRVTTSFAGWAANTSNTANTNALVLFLR